MKRTVKYLMGIYCAVAQRHSEFITSFMGYQYCGRCDEQIGDTLLSVGCGNVIGISEYHDRDCKDCEEVRKTWRGLRKYYKPIEERLMRWVNI